MSKGKNNRHSRAAAVGGVFWRCWRSSTLCWDKKSCFFDTQKTFKARKYVHLLSCSRHSKTLRSLRAQHYESFVYTSRKVSYGWNPTAFLGHHTNSQQFTAPILLLCSVGPVNKQPCGGRHQAQQQRVIPDAKLPPFRDPVLGAILLHVRYHVQACAGSESHDGNHPPVHRSRHGAPHGNTHVAQDRRNPCNSGS